MHLIKILCTVLLFINTAHAQSCPWTDLPQSKIVESTAGEKKLLKLQLDTLLQQREQGHPSPLSFVTKNWYSVPSAKIGFGYVTEQGQPYGIWRYYIVSKSRFDLFCEGTYGRLAAPDLLIDNELEARYATVDFNEIKQAFTRNLRDKFYFTGEWRFYAQGKLSKIVQLDNKVTLPLEESVDEKAITRLILPTMDSQRLAGTPLSTTHFSSSGFITHILANGVNQKFDKAGKPVIEPLIEASFVE